MLGHSFWITTLTLRLNVKQHDFSVQMYNQCRTFARFSLYHTLDQDICLLDSTRGKSKAQVVHTKCLNPTSCCTHYVQISNFSKSSLFEVRSIFFNSTLHTFPVCISWKRNSNYKRQLYVIYLKGIWCMPAFSNQLQQYFRTPKIKICIPEFLSSFFCMVQPSNVQYRRLQPTPSQTSFGSSSSASQIIW